MPAMQKHRSPFLKTGVAFGLFLRFEFWQGRDNRLHDQLNTNYQGAIGLRDSSPHNSLLTLTQHINQINYSSSQALLARKP